MANARISVVEFDGNDETLLAESIDLLCKMKQEGLDFVDISVGFNTPHAEIPWAPNFLADIAKMVRQETHLPGTTSWYISDPKEADALIREDKIDLVTLGRPLLAEPHWPYRAAQTLNVDNPAWTTLPPAYAYWLAKYR